MVSWFFSQQEFPDNLLADPLQHLSTGDKHATFSPLQRLLLQHLSSGDKQLKVTAGLRDWHLKSRGLPWPQGLWQELPVSQQIETELAAAELDSLSLSLPGQLDVDWQGLQQSSLHISSQESGVARFIQGSADSLISLRDVSFPGQ